MLKGIPPIISPDLMRVLMEMGHGDELVLGDGNFPAAAYAKPKRLVRCDGHAMPELLDAILQLLPLDTFVEYPVALMEVVPGDSTQPTIWEEYRTIIRKHDNHFSDFEFEARFAFYERARKAFAVVATSERALYANIILKKGVVVA
ncbi:RbsD or FucU transport [Candidatus Vecturithrix granuli]|uniref:RbsD or FucU transport n=1 Tax=Vecturithrix granuli TaxID=1499967 RepID=A0A081C3T9_VECG1|nr:RbsD or FucU transport [Candidatus Vecturithrix granuli]